MLCLLSTDSVKQSQTRSDFPPHQLATINSPNLRPRAAINYATRPLPPISSSSSTVTASSSVPSSPAGRKSSSSVLGRSKAKITDVRRPDPLVVSKPETLDAAYTPLLSVTDNSLSSSTGSNKRQTPTDASPVVVRVSRGLPRMTASAKTQTGPSLPRAADTEALRIRAGNSTASARPTTSTPAATAAASVQRRRLPSPPPCDVVDERRRGSRRTGAASTGQVASSHSAVAVSAAATSHVTPSRSQCMFCCSLIMITGTCNLTTLPWMRPWPLLQTSLILQSFLACRQLKNPFHCKLDCFVISI